MALTTRLVGSGRWLIGTYDGGLNVLASTNESIQRNHDYETSTIFEGKKVTFKVDGDTKVTYTFDADINNGSTYFLRPFNRGSTHEDFAGIRYNKASHLFKAEEGKLLVWPSFMLHGSKPYTGEKNRIIISANADVDLIK